MANGTKQMNDPQLPKASTGAELRDVNEQLLISALREQELAAMLEAERARLDAILRNIGDAVLVVDREGNPVLTNEAYTRMIGDPEVVILLEDASGHTIPFEEAPWWRAARGEDFTMEFSTVAADGTHHWWEANGRPIGIEPGVQGGVVVIRDISVRKRLEQALYHQAVHDPLTGLPNRTLLYDRLDRALRAAQRNGSPIALLMLDFDHFKEINDRLGHHAGDTLLREIGTRLLLVLRAVDTVARMGGDEFALLLPGTGPSGALVAAERVQARLEAPVALEGQIVHIKVSIGIANWTKRNTDAQALLRLADIAMYEAKRTKSGYAVYTAALGIESRRTEDGE